MQVYKVEYPIRIDQISLGVFGTVTYTQDILKINPDLLDKPILEIGTFVFLPNIKDGETKAGVNLWS